MRDKTRISRKEYDRIFLNNVDFARFGDVLLNHDLDRFFFVDRT